MKKDLNETLYLDVKNVFFHNADFNYKRFSIQRLFLNDSCQNGSIVFVLYLPELSPCLVYAHISLQYSGRLKSVLLSR